MRPHELQVRYQRNMLLGMVSATALLVALAITLGQLGRPPAAESHAPEITEQQPPVSDGSDDRTVQSGGPAPSMLNPYATVHAGFLGFRDLTPQSHNAAAIHIRAVDNRVSYLTVEAFGSIAVDPEMMAGEVYGSDWFTPGGSSNPAGDELRAVNRQVEVIHRVRPKVPPVAQWDGRVGIVEVLLLVDVHGRARWFSCAGSSRTPPSVPSFELAVARTDRDPAVLTFFVDPNANDLLYLLLDERPSGYHFADYLLHVLPEWRFSPAVVDGQPVDRFVILEYRFCAPDNPECDELLVRSVMLE